MRWFDPIQIFIDRQLRSRVGALEDLFILGCRAESSIIIEAHEDAMIRALDRKYFRSALNMERNIRVLEWYQAGYTQAEIGIFEGISQQAISKIIKKMIAAGCKNP